MTDHLAAQIRGWREGADLSQRQLADRVGVTPLTVGRWERGVSRPNRRNIEAIRAATQGHVEISTNPGRAAIYELAESLAALELSMNQLKRQVAAIERAVGVDPVVAGALADLEEAAAVDRRTAPGARPGVEPDASKSRRAG